MARRGLSVTIHRLPLRVPFTIARGSVTEIDVVRVSLSEDSRIGRGECRPYPRYGESADSVRASIEALRDTLENAPSSDVVDALLPAGAARNAVDCAFVDLRCKLTDTRAHDLLHQPPPTPRTTAITLSLATPEEMATAARALASTPLLKIKLGGTDGLDDERLLRVREAAPEARLIVDANEGWSDRELDHLLECAKRVNACLIEQPLPEGRDQALRNASHDVPICADESLHTAADLDSLRDRYEFINIKLDKAGGVRPALELARKAREHGMGIMLGCMVSSSLAIAPALLLSHFAEFIDLDGPRWLRADFEPSIEFHESTMGTAPPELWG